MTKEEKKKPPTQWDKIRGALASISVEPVMLLDGLAYNNMTVYLESLQMNKICTVRLNFSETVCDNLTAYKDLPEYQQSVNSFQMINHIIMSAIPLFFILFIGSWSDKYGRKVPLVASLLGHVLYSAGYLLISRVAHWPVEYLLIPAFLESLGGGIVSFLTSSNAYISDVTSEEKRTARVGLANSIWFLGGPIGALLGVWINTVGGYTATFTTSLVMYALALLYALLLLPESHGPFADQERLQKIRPPQETLRFRDSILRVYGLSRRKKIPKNSKEQRSKVTIKQMLVDFLNYHRLVDSIKCVLRKRDGYVRMFILLLIFSGVLRRLGRGAQMFLFLQKMLAWDRQNYGLWQSYKNLLTSMGSLLAVPILTTKLHVSDYMLGMVGACSSILDYVFYGLVSPSLNAFVWIGPAAALLVNSLSIAIRAMLSKFVAPEEMGKVSAVMGALDGVMPMIVAPIYKSIYASTLQIFPGTIFYFGAGANLFIALIFVLIMIVDKGQKYDLEGAKLPTIKGNVREVRMLQRENSNWYYDEKKKSVRFSTVILSSVNYSIEVSLIEKTLKEEPEDIDKEENKHGKDNPGFHICE